MDERLTIKRANTLLNKAGITAKWGSIADFLHSARLVRDVVKDMTAKQRNNYDWLKDWAEDFAKLYDRFDKVAAADPMIMYQPAHQVSLEFHQSPAFCRYFMAGNRTSKTQSGYAEHYFVTTGQHKWRTFPARTQRNPMMTFVVGLAYTKYAPAVFESKLINGEQSNPLSPMFPIGGKWFYHYDERKKILQIACKECAESGKAGSCNHPKSEIKLFSDDGGWEVLQGAQYVLGHFDEHIGDGWYEEAKQRLAVAKNSSLIVTGSPLFGDEAWEIRKLYNLWMEGAPTNLQENGTPIVTVHQISQFDAGIVDPSVIRRNMADMDEFEIEARIMGKPAPLARNPIFDRRTIADMLKQARDPDIGQLIVQDDLPLAEINSRSNFVLVPPTNGQTSHFKIWEHPQPNAVYVIGVDTAKGMVRPNGSNKMGDASAASVLKVERVGVGIKATMVAQYYGWINMFDYAEEVFKLANYYNEALVIIELTGGFGEAVMLRMRQDLYYWNIFRDEANHAQAQPAQSGRFGIETNMRTKPYMVAAMQQFVKDGMIDIPCRGTLQEMLSFEQERTERNLVAPRYRGVGGAKDDRVMSLIIAVSVLAQPQVVDYISYSVQTPNSEPYSREWESIHKDLKDAQREDPYE